MRPKRLGPALPPAVAAVSATEIRPSELGIPLFYASLRQVLELPKSTSQEDTFAAADDEGLGFVPMRWPDGTTGLVVWDLTDGTAPDGEDLTSAYLAWRRWWQVRIELAAGSA